MSARERKRKRLNNNQNRFFQEYNFEILVLGLFIVGFFLLWEKWNIKSLVWGFTTSSVRSLLTIVRDISVSIGNIISGIETSDMIGIIFILIAIILVMNRARIRIIDSHPNLLSCPKCEGGLHRTHRKTKHKIQGFILRCKIKRFKCRKCSFDVISMIGGRGK